MHSSGSITRKFGPFVEAVHRADLDAVRVLALDAGFGDDEGHASDSGGSPDFASGAFVPQRRRSRSARSYGSEARSRPAARSSRSGAARIRCWGTRARARESRAPSNSCVSRLSCADAEVGRPQPRAEKHVHLVGVQHVHDRAAGCRSRRARALPPSHSRAAACSSVSPFSMNPAGNGPVAAPRLDGALADQDAALVLGHAAHHELRVPVVDRPAGGADRSRQVVAFGDAQHDGRRAARAELHRGDCRRARRACQGRRADAARPPLYTAPPAAGMAELADAVDSKSTGSEDSCGFDSRSRHQPYFSLTCDLFRAPGI